MENRGQGLNVVSAGFVLAGLLYFGRVYPLPTGILFFTGMVLISAGIFLEESALCCNPKGRNAANLRLAVTMGCCLCIAVIGYNLVLYLRNLYAGGQKLLFRYHMLLMAGREMFHIGMLICVILSFHRGWCRFSGSYLAGSYFLLWTVSGSWLVLAGFIPETPGRQLMAAFREVCRLLYCVGMLLFFQRTFRRSLNCADCRALYQTLEESDALESKDAQDAGSKWLKVSSVIYTVLAIIGTGASSFIIVLHYLDLMDGKISIWLNEGLIFIVVCMLFDNLFYLFAGLYGICSVKKPENAKKCRILGWLLLAGAVIMFLTGCVFVVNSAWLLVESMGKTVLLPAMLRFVLAVMYLKGGKELWKKRRK